MAQMQPFTLQEVRLTNGVFKNAQDVDLKYILALNPDKLLAPYLIDAGLETKIERKMILTTTSSTKKLPPIFALPKLGIP